MLGSCLRTLAVIRVSIDDVQNKSLFPRQRLVKRKNPARRCNCQKRALLGKCHSSIKIMQWLISELFGSNHDNKT